MTKLRLTCVAVLLATAVIIAGAALSALGPERIVLGEAQLQERVNRELPRQFRGVAVESATVSFSDGRISLRAQTRATALGKSFAVVALTRGVPQYNAERGEVFFAAEECGLRTRRAELSEAAWVAHRRTPW